MGKSQERTYLLGPRERKGLFAGWRVSQVITVGGGCFGAMGCVVISSSAPGFFLALCFVICSIVMASIPLKGRSIDEWVPVIARYFRAHGPGELPVCSIVSGEHFGLSPDLGVLEEASGARSIVLFVESTGISLLSPEAKDHRVDGFITALSSLARERSVVDRASWTMWSTGLESTRFMKDLRVRGVHGTDQALDGYRDFLSQVTALGTTRHIALTLRAKLRSRRSGTELSALVDEGTTIAQALRESGHQGVTFGTPEELIELFKEHFGLKTETQEEKTNFSLSVTRQFSLLTRDGSAMTSWWIAEWPKQEVTAELLMPLFYGDPKRTVSVVVEAIPPSTALRRAQSAKTTRAADDELRRRGGFLLDRRREREANHLLAREAELVDGHGSIRMVGFVGVSAPDEESLLAAVAETELAGVQAHLALQRLHGDHTRGFLCTLPLAGGLP